MREVEWVIELELQQKAGRCHGSNLQAMSTCVFLELAFFSLQISKTTPWFKVVFLRLQSVFVLFLFVCFFKMNIWGSYNSNCAVLGYDKGAYQNILLNIILSLEGMELESLIMKDLEESDGLYSALSQKCQFLWQQ